MATHSSVLSWRIPGTGGAWWAAVYGVAQSQTRLKRLSSRGMIRGNKNIPRCSCVKGCNLCCKFSVPREKGMDEGPPYYWTLCPGTNLSVATLISGFMHSGPSPPRQAQEAWPSPGRHGGLCGLQKTHADSPPTTMNIQTCVPHLAGHFQDCGYCHTLPKLST